MSTEPIKVWGIKYPNDPYFKGVDWWAVKPNPDNDFVIGSLGSALTWNSEAAAALGLAAVRYAGKYPRVAPAGCLQPRPSPFYIHPDGSRTEHPPTVSNVPPNYTLAGYTDFGAVKVPRYEDIDTARWSSRWRGLDKIAYDHAMSLKNPIFSDAPGQYQPWPPTSKSRQIALAHDILDMLQ